MNKFLKILIFLLVLIAILAVAAMALSPKKLVLEESITIDAPPHVAYNLVSDFKQWDQWSPWMEIDPDATFTYTDKTAGVGAQFSWDGNEELGTGTQTIKEAVANKSIKTGLVFGSWDGESHVNWTFTPDGDKTKVSWDMDGAETAFPFRPFNLIMKGGLKKTYKQGLNNLKAVVEDRAKNKVYGGYKITEAYQGPKHYIMNRQVVDMANIQNFYTSNLGALFQKTQGKKLEMDGMPSGLFYSWDESSGKTDMAAAIPLQTPASIPGAISQTLPDGKVLQVDYLGDYNKTEAAHLAVEQYMADHDLLVNYPIVQEYVTDPTTEPDINKWLTKITYYVTMSTQ